MGGYFAAQANVLAIMILYIYMLLFAHYPSPLLQYV